MPLEFHDNPSRSLLFVGAADPEASGDDDPAAGNYRLVIDDTGAAWIVDETGTATAVGGAGTTVATDVIWNAAGDLVQGTGSDAAARLALGTALQVLRVNSGATAVEWGTAAASNPSVSTARVATGQTTTSTTYADLATSGPAVTVTVPASGKVRVTVSCGAFPNTGSPIIHVMGFALSSGNTVAASDSTAAADTIVTAGFSRLTSTVVLTGLTPGSTVFTAKYRVNTGTGTFNEREINVEIVD